MGMAFVPPSPLPFSLPSHNHSKQFCTMKMRIKELPGNSGWISYQHACDDEKLKMNALQLKKVH